MTCNFLDVLERDKAVMQRYEIVEDDKTVMIKKMKQGVELAKIEVSNSMLSVHARSALA